MAERSRSSALRTAMLSWRTYATAEGTFWAMITARIPADQPSAGQSAPPGRLSRSMMWAVIHGSTQTGLCLRTKKSTANARCPQSGRKTCSRVATGFAPR